MDIGEIQRIVRVRPEILPDHQPVPERVPVPATPEPEAMPV